MSDEALLMKMQERHAELFSKACRGYGSRYDDIEMEVLERRMKEFRRKGAEHSALIQCQRRA